MNISTRTLFPEIPTIRFESDMRQCLCERELKVLKTHRRTVTTFEIGEFHVYEILKYCDTCKQVYRSEELKRLVSDSCKFGFDVMVYIGSALFIDCHNEGEIQHTLKDRNILISRSEIAYLAKKFIVYLALAHKESGAKLKETIQNRGGYILHVDAMCDGDSPHLMSVLDEVSEMVLGNIKLPTEKAEKIIPFFETIKRTFGNPLAIVHDMGKGISNAVKEVFKNILDFVCHYHFLRDIGKDLFGKENDVIRNRLKYHGIQGLLRRMATQNKKVIDRHPDMIDCFVMSLETENIKETTLKHTPHVAAYTIIQWALDGKKQSNGYGFPFDRPYMVFYRRLERIYFVCEQLQEMQLRGCVKDNKPFLKIRRLLQNTLNDKNLRIAVAQMQEKTSVFDKLRDAMRITDPEGKHGINDDGEDTDIKTIEKRVKDFREWLIHENCFKENKGYQKMVVQIDKYWKQLFADPIVVNTPHGKITIQPQRTNNILERFFRSIRYGYRRKSGKNSLNKTLKALLSDTPLVKNLKNPEYVEILLNGKATLEERFAEIDIKIVRKELKKSQEDSERIPPKIKTIIKKTELPEIMVNFFAKQLK